jgi:endoglucanase
MPLWPARAARGWIGRAASLSLVLVVVVIAAGLPWPDEGPTLAAPAAAITDLHASGNQIVNSSGQPVRLRGVNRTSGEYACIQGWGIFEGPTDAAAIQAMVNWKITAVRVPLNEDCWLNVNTSGIDPQYVGASYRNAVADYVNRLTAAGIVVILDLHWAAPGSQRADQQYPMANRDHSVAFWSSVATPSSRIRPSSSTCSTSRTRTTIGTPPLRGSASATAPMAPAPVPVSGTRRPACRSC